MSRLGFKIDARPGEDVAGLAQLCERSGFAELWVCEDLGLAGGIAQSAIALGATTSLRVGLGIAPAAVRNPAYLAMEYATLTRAYPGRFVGGLGHGVPDWLTQVGQRPDSLMARLSETAVTVRRLLAGEHVTFSGREVQLTDVALADPPLRPPDLSLGVRGPKGIELARERGFGVVLAEGSGPDYVRQVRAKLGDGLDITVFAWANLDPHGAADALRTRVATSLTRDADLGADVIDELTVSGDLDSCLRSVRRLVDSGADSVVLQPIRGREEQQLAAFADAAEVVNR